MGLWAAPARPVSSWAATAGTGFVGHLGVAGDPFPVGEAPIAEDINNKKKHHGADHEVLENICTPSFPSLCPIGPFSYVPKQVSDM